MYLRLFSIWLLSIHQESYNKMTHIVCSSNNIKVYRHVLKNTYKNRKINYNDLKSCIKHTCKDVKFVDIIIQNNEFNLQICCDENIGSNDKRYFDIVDKHKSNTNKKVIDEEYSDYDVSFVKVARELNEWHIGTFILDKINTYDCDTDIEPNKSVIIPMGIPISRIEEFYGVRGLNV